ncbi:hypothetical protein GCM10009827_062170 [Dactylosporangium maewongense]|uniref:Dolichyl-phosphate-mannose-protein mannosyltransferase n=1 Tax=Dactylosporangium maewongense TaxID=634393 RepID=A0ABN2BBC1_9ACTN
MTGAWRMTGAWLREHRALAGLVAAGALLRVGMMAAYYPAFGYFYDTRAYMDAASSGTPSPIWPFGYPAMLKVLGTTGHIASVSAVQHLMGLVMGVGIYALCTRRGVRRSWSALAAAPVLLDARQIQLEHYVLSETLFSFLLLTGVALLMWSRRPPLWLMGLSGLVFALVTLTRTVGQPIAALVVLYLIVRRVGWRRIALFTVSLVVPVVAYMVWYDRHYDAYALNSYTGRYLWQRTTTFVDCTRTDFTPQERQICPPEPLGHREVSDVYLWELDRDRIGARYPGPEHDWLFRHFALKAIREQPGDFAAAVATDAWHLVQPGWPAPARIACTTDLWTMPSGGRSGNQVSNCTATLMARGFQPAGSGGAAPTVTPLNSALWAYGQTVVMPPSALVLLALFALAATVRRRRGGGRRLRDREAADSVLLAVMSLSLLMLGVTLSVIDLRFLVPLLVTAPLAAVLAAHRLASRPTAPDAAPAPTGSPEPALSAEDTAASTRRVHTAGVETSRRKATGIPRSRTPRR